MMLLHARVMILGMTWLCSLVGQGGHTSALVETSVLWLISVEYSTFKLYYQ